MRGCHGSVRRSGSLVVHGVVARSVRRLSLRFVGDLVRSAALSGFTDVVAAAGGDAPAMLRRFGIDAAALADDAALIPHDGVVQVLEHAAQALGVADLGLRVGERQDEGILGLLSVVMQHSATVGEALDATCRFMFVHSPAVNVSAEPGPDADTIALVYRTTSPPPLGQLNEMVMHFAHRLVQRHAPGTRLFGVEFSHAPISSPDRYHECFGAPVRFGRERTALLLPATLLSVSMPAANPHVRQMAIDYLSLRFAAPEQDVAVQVRGYVERILGTGATDVASVADALGIHPRTLQRRLAAEGTTYGEVLDGVRREVALRHLAHSDLPLAQLAAALGLGDQSTLTRYVVRWFGKPPNRLRREGVAARG